MVDAVPVNALNLTGRVTTRPEQLGNVFATNNLDLSGETNVNYQFGVQSQDQTFGVVRSMFMDNGSNPSNVEVYVSGTDQFFTIPAYSIGYYTIEANQGSTVSIVSDGGSTEIATITFFNWERAPVVWYSFGAFNSDRPIRAQGAMEEGDSVTATDFNMPVYMGGIDRTTGLFHGIKVDSDGRLDFASTVTIGGVVGGDPMGQPPINPGFPQAVLDSTGDLVFVQLNAANEFIVTDGPANTKLTAISVQLATLIENTDKSTTGTASSVASATADTVILASNVQRQGATIFNDSTAILYLLLANAVATNAIYSVQIAAGGYFEVPAKYSGIIKGIWAAANGAARVTELT